MASISKQAFSRIAAGTAALILSGCGGSGGGGGVNEAPIIVSADDVNTTFDIQTELTANAYDPDGDALSYEWKIDGTVVSDAEAFVHTFTAGDHTVELKVTDDEGLSASESFNVHVPVYMRLLKTECFNETDALIYRSYSGYDSHGNLLNTLYDEDGDGTLDRGIAFVYDEHNRRIGSSEDFDGDGVPDYAGTTEYTEAGYIAAVYIDDNADGTLDSASYRYYPDSLSRRYSGDSSLYPAERIEYDYDADGTIDLVSQFKYDAFKNNTEYSQSSGDGILNYRVTRDYDETGRLMLETTDHDGDGASDRIATYTWTATTSEIRTDTDNDGSIDSLIFMTLDENGNILSHKYDSTNDGFWNMIETNTYDGDSRLLSHAWDSDADGIPEYISTYTYDAAGNLLSHTYDVEIGGSPDFIKRYLYDEQGNRINYFYDRNGDGSDEVRCRYSHGGNYPVPMEYDYEE